MCINVGFVLCTVDAKMIFYFFFNVLYYYIWFYIFVVEHEQFGSQTSGTVGKLIKKSELISLNSTHEQLKKHTCTHTHTGKFKSTQL